MLTHIVTRVQSRIEELESRCQRLTTQARTLTAEKEELAKNLALLRNVLQVRDLQLVAVTTQLAQLASTTNADIKQEVSSQDDISNLEALSQQQTTLQALEALQSAAQPSALPLLEVCLNLPILQSRKALSNVLLSFIDLSPYAHQSTPTRA